MEWTITIPTFKVDHPTLQRVKAYSLQNLHEDLNLEDLARAAKVTTYYLCRLFREQLGITPIKWLWLQRTMAAGAYITKEQNRNLTDIAFACGFSSSAHFSRQFKLVYGVSPKEYKRKYEIKNTQDSTALFMIPSSMTFKNLDYAEYVSF